MDTRMQAKQEEGSLLKPDTQYPAWSPYNSYEAAGSLLKLLNDDQPEHSHALSK